MARAPTPATQAELLRFVKDAVPLLRELASRVMDGLPGRTRLQLRRLADRADRLMERPTER